MQDFDYLLVGSKIAYISGIIEPSPIKSKKDLKISKLNINQKKFFFLKVLFYIEVIYCSFKYYVYISKLFNFN